VLDPLTRARLVVALVCLTAVPALAQTPSAAGSAQKNQPAAGSGDLDAFMKKVLARREVNRQTLQQYILDDVETFEMLGPGRIPLIRGKREFSWYVRDGLHVRSPVRFDGVTVGEADRRKYEDEWIARERGRLERRAKRKATEPGSPEAEPSGPPVSGETPVATPRFVSEAYFMDFRFEAGTYYLAGREELAGKRVLRIEYYPTRMFNIDNDDDDDDKADDPDRQKDRERKPPSDKERRREEVINRKMNKTALVTLWVDPGEFQIVKYTFDNVWLDFLPAGWLVKVDGIHASMTMGQPFPNVWLPNQIDLQAGFSLAPGAFEVNYARRFANYKLAEVTSTIRVPKHEDAMRVQGSGFRVQGSEEAEPHGPFVGDDDRQQAQGEMLREIRVHGNASVTDDDVIKLAGLTIGQPISEATAAEAEQRLKQSGRFESVEVRKRYRSLTDETDVAMVLVGHEKPGVMSTATGIARNGGAGRVGNRLMFLPILNYQDGYGFSFGGRFSTRDLLGAGEHLSVPLTWGGTRRAALEADRTFKRGPLTRIASSIAIWQNENPHFRVDDRRVELTGRVERQFARVVRTGFEASTATVDFGGVDDRYWSLGANAALDTRADPNFPRNAIYLGAGWNGLNIRSEASRIDVYTTDGRGYVGLIGQAVAALRLQYSTASSPLPDFERLMLGGAASLRGFRTGTFDGDRVLATSAEVRVPITSVLNSAKLGLDGFFDAGKAWDHGMRVQDTDWHRGVGGGVFIIAPLVKLNLDVAHGLKDGDTRVHFSAGFSF